MGHWEDLLVDELATRFPHADRDRLAALAQEAGTEIETLTGQSFGPAKQNSVSIDTFGLPFVELPGLLIGSQEGPSGMWPIPTRSTGSEPPLSRSGQSRFQGPYYSR
jgi:hypothetical protein